VILKNLVECSFERVRGWKSICLLHWRMQKIFIHLKMWIFWTQITMGGHY